MFEPNITSKIIKRSHGFVIKHPTKAMLPAIYKLSNLYTTHQYLYDPHLKKKVWKPYKTYGIYVDHGREFRFHIEQYNEFMSLLRNQGVDESSYEIEEEAMFEGDDVELELNGQRQLYDYQKDAVEYVLEEDSRNKLIMLKTGKGKSFTSLAAAVRLGKRFAVLALGGYVEKWVGDITSNLKIDKREICVIRGSDSLMRATNYPGSGYDIPKVFVISLNTISKWYQLYEENLNHPQLEAYACSPTDFYEHLGIGTAIFDEVHQHLHAVYRAFTFTHIPKTIGMSATIVSKDMVIQRIQNMMFPKSQRYDNVVGDNYITTHACSYHIQNFKYSGIQTSEFGSNSYSHVAFERSLLTKKKKNVLKQYLTMISDLVEEAYISRRVDDDKLAIFVSTKAMAETVRDHLRKVYPKLDIRSYLQENDFADVLEPDIRVTTILSAGTAIDIPGLRASILTISVDSPTANLQTFGRLREMKHRKENNDVHFYYIYCSDIKKQVDYHKYRYDLLKGESKLMLTHDLGTIYTDKDGPPALHSVSSSSVVTLPRVESHYKPPTVVAWKKPSWVQ